MSMTELSEKKERSINLTIEHSIQFKDVVLGRILESQPMVVKMESKAGNLELLKAQWGYRSLLYSHASMLAMILLQQENYFEVPSATEVSRRMSEALEQTDSDQPLDKISSDLKSLEKIAIEYVDLYEDDLRAKDPEQVLLDLLRAPLGLISHLNEGDIEEVLINETRNNQVQFVDILLA
jgi:hypothetical protein